MIFEKEGERKEERKMEDMEGITPYMGMLKIAACGYIKH